MQKLLAVLVLMLFFISCSDGGKPKNDNAKDDNSVIMDSDTTVTDLDSVSDIDNIENDVDIIKHDNDTTETDKDIADDDVDVYESDADSVEPDDDADTDADTEPEEYSFDGIVQKGPFIKDSSIKVTELDSNFEMIPATTFTTKTVDDLGNFNIKRKFKSRYIEIEATGFYYDEVSGTVSSAQITNYVFVDLYANKSKVNINILTTLARKRVQHLMKNGSNYTEATTQSETELLEIFGIYGELSSNFQDMNILQAGSSNAMLLAISARLQGSNTPGELSNLIAGIIYDIEKDGTLDQLSLKNKLSDGGRYISSKLIAIRNNLETHFGEIATVSVSNFEDYCDDDGDGVINKWDFTLTLNPVNNAQFSTPYISNSIEIVLPYGANDATAKVTNGTVVINGIDTGVLNTSVSSLDTVAVKLTTGDTYNVSVSGILSVTYTAIGLGSQENKGTFVVTTSCESGVSRTIDCEGGTQNQICNDGIWSNVGNCEPKNCTTEGSFRQISCGNNGKQTQKCVSSLWVNEGICVEKLADPVFVLPAGTYQTAQNVEITHPENEVVIKYTVNDPLDPSEGYGLVYTGAINIPTDETTETVRTIKAKAYKSGFETSNMVTREYTVTGKVATPQFNFGTGTYNTEKAVSITTATPGATIKYTLDGTTPNETNGMVYTGAVNITESKTLKAFAYKTNWLNSNVGSASYTLKPATPTFNPTSGTYSTDQNVVITTSITDGVIIYTLDGSEPSEINGTTYTVPVNLTANTTDETFPVIKAKVFKPGWSDSDTGTANYNMTGKVEAPTMNPVPGTYSSQQSIVLSTVTSGTTIRYTTDKTEPTSGSTLYTVPIVIPSNQINETLREIRAKAFLTDWIDSETTTGNYTVTGTVVMPQFSLVAGTYNTDQTVTITTTTSDASIRYTTDGTDPSDTTGNIYTSPVDITATTKLKAVAYKTDWTNSSVQSSDYTMKMSDPVFSVFSGTYTTTQNITLSTLSPHSEIRYTTNGDDPDETSALYTGAIELPANEINETTTPIKAKTFSTEFGWDDSGITENTYRITGTVATPVLSPVGGTYTTSQSVTITCATNGAMIRYTTNGDEPTTSSPLYSSPFTLEDGAITTVKAKAFRTDWVTSGIASSTYEIDNIPAPTISPEGGVFDYTVPNVTITTPISGATIRYTLDGTEPTGSSAIYSTPLTFAVSRHLVARVFKSGITESQKAEEGYIVSGERTTKQWGSPEMDYGNGMAIDPFGNIYIAGYTLGGIDGNIWNVGYCASGYPCSDAFLTKWNSSGEKEWTRQWGTTTYEQATSVAVDLSGNIYVTGYTYGSLDGNASAGNIDIFLTKWNSNGEKLWTKQWGTSAIDNGDSVDVDSSGNIYVSGYTEGSLDGNTLAGFSDIFLTKFNSDGGKQWTKQWGTISYDALSSLTIDSSDNVYVSGYTGKSLDGNIWAGNTDVFLTKFNSDGEKQWTKQWGSEQYEWNYFAYADFLGNIYVTGNTSGALDGNINAGKSDIFLTKFNNDGEKQWTRQWGSSENDSGYSITADLLGNIYVTGSTRESLDGNFWRGSADIFLTKLSSDGEKLWTKQWGTEDSNNGKALGVDSFGNIYLVGYTDTLDGNLSIGKGDVFLTRIEAFPPDLGCQLTATPTLGIYNTPQSVSLSCSTEGSDIRFEINDPEPDMFSNPYENPIEISETSTLKAIAYKLGVAGYSKISPVYTIDEGLEQVAAPTFDPPNEGNNRKATLDIIIETTTPDVIIKYTIDGSEPSEINGLLYEGAITIFGTKTVKAKAFKIGMADSSITIANYRLINVLCTGQTKCYDNSLEITCPAPSSDFYGQDAQYAALGYCIPKSYTVSGTSPEEIVIDNNTGLHWQRVIPISYFGCTGGEPVGSKCTWQEAIDYCNGLNYGGHEDWSLPNDFELESIINYGRTSPAIDVDAFQYVISDAFWTSRSRKSDTTYAWVVLFPSGGTTSSNFFNPDQFKKYEEFRAMCVRERRLFEKSFIDFTSNSDIIISDTATKLYWTKESATDKTWQQALGHCETLDYGGYTDWRLPNINELKTLVNRSIYNPASNFPGITSNSFWSASSWIENTSWYISFDQGTVESFQGALKTTSKSVLCVR